MSDLSVITSRIDALARGWAEQFGLIQREITQAHRWQQDHELATERARKQRARNTRLWIAGIVALGTALNGAFQAIGSSNRSSLRAEILDEVRREQSDRETRLADAAASRAIEKRDNQLELLIRGSK